MAETNVETLFCKHHHTNNITNKINKIQSLHVNANKITLNINRLEKT